MRVEAFWRATIHHDYVYDVRVMELVGDFDSESLANANARRRLLELSGPEALTERSYQSLTAKVEIVLKVVQ